MSLPKDLLELAQHLANRERRRPRLATLRRSISTAYYALFHLLTSEAVGIVGSNLTLNAAHRLQRRFDHAEMKRAAAIFSAPNPASSSIRLLLGTSVSSDLRSVCQAFTEMQEERHTADYDLTSSWTRYDAQKLLRLTEDAFASWSRIRRSHEANLFALGLLSLKLIDKER